MAYYQILRQRRRDLELSIEDVSSQTRLAPQYIQAIEENNLDVFLDDFDFVRYFVHAYSDAIGVNWEMIKDEVDLNIDQYARLKSMSYTQAQRKIAEQKPMLEEPENEPTFQQISRPATNKKNQKKKNKRKKAEAKVSATAKKAYKWSKASTRNFAIAVVVLVVAGLVVANLILNKMSSSQEAAEEAEKQAELKAKEEETAKLANQKKQTSDSSDDDSSDSSDSSSSKDIQIENTDYENNIFTITNLVEGDQKLTIQITIPNYTTVAVYQDDTAINDGSVTYTEKYDQTFAIDHACVIQLEIGNWEDNEILVNGQTVTFNSVYWYEGQPAVLYFEVEDSSDTSDSSKDKTSSSDTTTSDTTTSDTSTDDSDTTEESE